MSDTILICITVLFALAVVTSDSFVVTLLYLLAGALLLGRLWTTRAMASITFQRLFPKRLFLGETITLKLDIINKSRLPVVWLRLQESLPLEIATMPFYQHVLSLGPRERTSLSYQLVARKRGYYSIGPLHLTSGDLLGFSKENRLEGAVDYITVYPRVIPLPKISLPSHSPIGNLRHKQPIFEDPNRPIGKRDYRTGDSMRRIDWKASAAVGRLQVKQFEPSIELETAIILNLNNQEYHYRERFDATELAIVAAASIANWSTTHKQAVGLVTNGSDPLGINNLAQPMTPQKGRSHLIRILETLARIKSADAQPVAGLIHQHRVNLAWGTTLVVITGQAEKSLFDEFFRAQRAGLDIVLILCGHVIGLQEIRQHARRFNIPVYALWSEKDLEHWQN